MATIELGDDGEYTVEENGNDLVIRHVPSDNQIRYNYSEGEWQHDPPLNGGGDVDLLGIEGIESANRMVGALCGGTYHDSRTDGPGGYGILFEASDITIHNVVVDADSSTSDQPIELRQYENNAVDPTIIDSVTPSLDSGAQRVTLDFDVPASGDPNADSDDLYWLGRGPVPAGDEVGLRRLFVDSGEWSSAEYDDEVYPDVGIDFVRGGHSGDYDLEGDSAAESWYFFFDWQVSDESTRVMSPWSTDVEEIYARPRPPEEEFGEDGVHPRSIWIDTS